MANEDNLSQLGNCWIFDDAVVRDNAQVCDNARVWDNAIVWDHAAIQDNAVVRDNVVVWGDALVRGDVQVYDNAEVCGDAEVCGKTDICGDAIISSDRDYIVFKNWWSSGRYFTWTRSNNMWKVGCFYGTGEELIAKAYKDSEEKGREYECIVKYVERILNTEESKTNK